MKRMVVLMTGVALALTACGNKDGDSLAEGQTIARVGSEEVTVHELNSEMQGASIPDAKQRKLFEQAMLQRIIDRKILADIAREQKLDESPEYLLLKKRAEEAVLVQLLQQKVAREVKRPTPAEARAFVQANPNMFEQRKIYVLDQLSFPVPQDPSRLRELAPLKTLGEIERWLIDNGISYRRLPATLDLLRLAPEMANRITSLPAGEVFVVPAGNVVTASVITGTKVEPVSGDEATNVAGQMLFQQAVMKSANAQLEKEVKTRRDAVKYQKGYEPPKPAAGGPAAAPAPAAANPAPAPAKAGGTKISPEAAGVTN